MEIKKIKNKNTKIVVGVVVIILGLIGINVIERINIRANSKKLINTINSNAVKETIELSEITDFQWDTILEFNPYYPNDGIYDIIGQQYIGLISESLSESHKQIVFLNKNKVVAYIGGYQSFSLYFKETSSIEGGSKFLRKKNNKFKVESDSEYKRLEEL